MSPQFPGDDPYSQHQAQELARQHGGRVVEVNHNNVFYGYDVESPTVAPVRRARKKVATK